MRYEDFEYEEKYNIEYVICPYCGEINSYPISRCRDCNKIIPKENLEYFNKTTKKDLTMTKSFIFIIIGALFMILVIYYVIYYN